MKVFTFGLGLAVTIVGSLGFSFLRDGLEGRTAGEERTIAGIKLSWCPPGKFVMGSPPSEPERRPGETRVAGILGGEV
jgi:hypothetical protein